MTTSALPPAALTPSEVIFLCHGNPAVEIKPEGIWDVRKPIVADLGTSLWDTARTAWRVAFLAAQQTGDIRLVARPKTVLLGLRTVKALYSEPLAGPGAWPSGSLEARTSRMPGEVQQVVYDCLGSEFDDPDKAVLDMIRDGLVARGLVRAIPVRKKILFIRYTSRHYELGQDIYSLAADCTQGVERLIRDCQTHQSDIWYLLSAEVARGIGRRQERGGRGCSD